MRGCVFQHPDDFGFLGLSSDFGRLGFDERRGECGNEETEKHRGRIQRLAPRGVEENVEIARTGDD